jgi:zinc transport system substrate-binding protein
MARFTTFSCLLAICLIASCGSAPSDGTEKLHVFVTILPQAFFAERIGGEHVTVEVLVGQGQSPHSYAPTPRQMTRLSRAGVFFRIGTPMEERLLMKIRSTNPDLLVVDTHKGIERHCSHDHCEEEDHEEMDPHIWLDPKLAMVLARTMAETLESLDPPNKAGYRKNLDTLLADLEELDRTIAKTLAPLRGRTFYVFHPAFGYFARAYRLHQKAVEMGGKSPGPRHVRTIIEGAKKEGVRVIFVQPQFDAKTAETIASRIGGAVVPIDPLSQDYIKNLKHMAQEIEKALKE